MTTTINKQTNNESPMDNLLVLQSRPEPLLHQPLMWAGGWHSLSGTKGPTQLLLIQQQPAIVGPPSTSFSTLTTVSTPADTLSRANKKSCSSRTSSKNHRHHAAGKNSYLPILNSYPRIAPHPRKEAQTQGKSSGALGRVKESGGSSGGGGGGEGQSQKKRVCTEEESVSTTARNLSSHHHHHHHHHHHGRHRDLHHSQQKVRRDSDTPAHLPSASHAKSYGRSRHSSRSNAVGLPSVSSSQMPCLPSHSSSSNSPSSASSSSSSCTTSYSSPSSLVAHSPYRPRPGRARSAAVTVAAAAAAASGYLSDSLSECSSVGQRRFLNTEEILSQSGLLAITLRTKELLKQSDAAEREIAQLRQHTQLLCRAALAGQRVPCNGSDVLQHLLGDMAHSGSYPGILETSGHGKAVGDNQKQSKRRGEAAKGEGREAEDQGRVKNTEQQQLVSPRGIDEGAAPSLFALSPEAEGMEQVNSLVGSLFMDKELTELTLSPESFTFDNYLF